MKRSWAAVVLVTLLALLVLPVQASHPASRVLMNGQEAAVYPPPQVIGGKLMLPVRSLAEQIGAQLAWDAATERVTLTRGGVPVTIGMGSSLALVDGQPLPLRAPARLVGSRAYVPLDFLRYALRLNAVWDNVSQTLLISGLDPAGAGTPPAPAGGTPAERSAAYFNAIRSGADMAAFLRDLPKGGDLHDHLTGAMYAETFIAYAVKDGLCLDQQSGTAIDCTGGAEKISMLINDSSWYNRLVDAWSMRNFVPRTTSGHDQFFSAFGKFGLANRGHGADMLADVLSRAGMEHTHYLELMFSLDNGAASSAASALAWQWDDGLDALSVQLEQSLNAAVRVAAQATQQWDPALRSALRCDTSSPDPGCGVAVRYLSTASRTNQNPAVVFAQLLFGMKLATADPAHVVGVNLLAAEDNPTAMAEYDRQMQMLDYLHQRYPAVHISLHAGELTPQYASAAGLCCHIRKAVAVGQAQRIGHGVDLMWEQDPYGLMAEMAQQHVLVEVNLTSNDQILGVRDQEHPFPLYLSQGVPVALSTDDPGIERIDLTHEYQRAVEEYGLTYEQVKALDRNSLIYSFLPGGSLWSWDQTALAAPCAADTPGAANPSAGCASFLAQSAKAQVQWGLERDLTAFEQRWGAPGGAEPLAGPSA